MTALLRLQGQQWVEFTRWGAAREDGRQGIREAHAVNVDCAPETGHQT